MDGKKCKNRSMSSSNPRSIQTAVISHRNNRAARIKFAVMSHQTTVISHQTARAASAASHANHEAMEANEVQIEGISASCPSLRFAWAKPEGQTPHPVCLLGVVALLGASCTATGLASNMEPVLNPASSGDGIPCEDKAPRLVCVPSANSREVAVLNFNSTGQLAISNVEPTWH
mmetsp:Transcript_25865/g.72131  ORF Transcript_25865/g.72131 Transcript_25865/m.72131 type:complete len:174 (-) Transcript_25865:356-877(-)